MSEVKTTESPVSAKKPHVMRRLYNWTVAWAERPGGAWALFFLALAESSFFPVPPDVLLLALCVGAPKKSFRFALICSAGSVAGGMIGYLIGWGAWESVRNLFIPHLFSEHAFETVQKLYQGNAFLAIVTAAFTPIPYKVFTIAAGVFQVNFFTLVFASMIGRSGRFFLVSGFIYFFGPKVKAMIEKYFDLGMWVFLVLLVLGFVLIKYAKH